MRPIRDYFKEHPGTVQYLGIAADEPKRLLRLRQKANRVSLLEKYAVSEAGARELCERYGLLFPIYQ